MPCIRQLWSTNWSTKWLLWFSLNSLLLTVLAGESSDNNNDDKDDTPSAISNNEEIGRSCEISGLYCSPQPSDHWYIGQPHLLRWNQKDPNILTDGSLTISLFLSDNSRDPIYTQTGVSNGDGTFPITVTRDQFYRFNDNTKSNSDNHQKFIEKKAWFVLVPSKGLGTIDSSRTLFSIIDPSPTKTTPAVRSTPSSEPDSDNHDDPAPPSPSPDLVHSPSYSKSGLPVYAIVLIALASVALALILFLLAFLVWRRQRRYQRRLDPGTLEKSIEAAALTDRPTSGQSEGLVPSGSRSSAQTVDSKSPLARNTNLSANDAIMLSETFRELLRKPSWVDETHSNHPDLDSSPTQPDTSITMRLEEELTLDGVGLHDLDSKRNLTVIHDHSENSDSDSDHDPQPSPI